MFIKLKPPLNTVTKGILKDLIKSILLFGMIFFFFSSEAKAQNNDFEAGFYNIVTGSIIGGIGAVINKKPEERFLKVAIKGLGQGALGGYFMFESKRLIRIFSKTGDYGYVWPSKIVSSAGSSVIENAAANRDFWDEWHLIVGFNRIEISTEKKFQVRYRIMPLALAGTIMSSQMGKFDFERTLKTGSLIFSTGQFDKKGNQTGFTYGRTNIFSSSIVILNNWEGEYALSHELIHAYQNEMLMGFNNYLDKPLTYLDNKNKISQAYNKIFYTDVSGFVGLFLYNIENNNQKDYQRNLFEKEAFYFTDQEWKSSVPPRLY